MRVAVVGLGSAGSRYGSILTAAGHAVLGFDPAAPLAEYDRADSLAEALEACDVAVVASPNSMHAEHALEAIAAGRPVLIEKPLATSAADARSVVDAALAAGVVCGVAMTLRFFEPIERIRTMIEGGEIGEPLLARASFGQDLREWRPGTDYRRAYSARSDLGGGIVLDAIHELDYLLWMLGPVRTVAAQVAHVSDLEIDVEDACVASLRFESGALGSVDLNFVEPGYRRGLSVVGSEASIHWDWHATSLRLARSDGATEIDYSADITASYPAVIADFLDCVDAGGQPRASLEDGLRAVELAEAIKRSSSEGVAVELGGSGR